MVVAISWGHRGPRATLLPSAPTPGSPTGSLSVQKGKVGMPVPWGSRGHPQRCPVTACPSPSHHPAGSPKKPPRHKVARQDIAVSI